MLEKDLVMNKEKINICLSSDDNFAPYLLTTITSILKNANEEDDIYFYIIDNGISLSNKEKLLNLKSIKEFHVSFASLNNEDINKYTNWINMNKHSSYSVSTYSILSIPNLFPDIDKILYLDCDLIVIKSLKELFNYDIDNYLAILADHAVWNYYRKNPKKFPDIHNYFISI